MFQTIVSLPLAVTSSSTPPLVQVGLSAVLFILLWQFVGNVLFKPYLQVLFEREKRTLGDDSAAKQAIEDKVSIEQEFDKALQKVKNFAVKDRDERLAKAKQSAHRMIDSAHSSAQGELAKGNRQIAMIQARAREGIEGETERLAGELYDKAISGITTC